MLYALLIGRRLVGLSGLLSLGRTCKVRVAFSLYKFIVGLLASVVLY